MGKHSGAGDSGDTGELTGRRRKIDAGRRGVSVGVIAAAVAVVLLVVGIVVWQFFGDALSRRSSDAASQCLQGTATVAVIVDPSIAEQVTAFADRYDADAAPVGDTCVDVVVTAAQSDPVVAGLSGEWPADLGDRPALWVPASSVQAARLQAAVGKQVVSDARSLVSSPVVLAVRPELTQALGQQGWPALPGLQTDPNALDSRNLPGWGSLRLALPTTGAADAAYLTVEAVAATSAPPNSSPAAGLAAAGSLVAAAPRLADASADTAWNALTTGPAGAAPVHAVALTEQELYRRTASLQDAAQRVAKWTPSGPAAVADYPTVLLAGDWLSEEQLAAASEFARFMRKPEQLSEFADAGFRAEGAEPTANDVVDFAPIAAPLPVADDAVRATVAGAVAPAAVATTTVMLNEGLTGDENRLANVAAALRNRLGTLPPTAAVGLWTFNRVDSTTAVPTGPLADPLGPQPRSVALTGVLEGLVPTGGGGVSFTTLRLVYGDALAKFRPGQPNSVLVITQGPHTDQSLDGPGLLDYVKSAVDPARPVAINVVGFPGDPDRPVWESVAQLTGGSFTEVPRSDSPDLVAAIARGLP